MSSEDDELATTDAKKVDAALPKSGYGYTSHFDTEKSGEAPAIKSPIKFSDALSFCSTMSRLREAPDSSEAKWWREKHPLLERYATEVHDVLHRADAARSSGQPQGLIRHIKKIMGWPSDASEWEAAREDRRVLPWHHGTGATTMRKNRGIRADTDVLRAVTEKRGVTKDYSLHSKYFMMYLYQRQWLPIDSQLPLWSVDGALVQTRADSICYDVKNPGTFILVEMKTGYAEGYRCEVTTLHKYFPHTPYHEHQLQLGWMHWRLQTYLKDIGTLRGFVVRVNSDSGVPAPFELAREVREYFAKRYAVSDSFEPQEPGAVAVAVIPRSAVPNLLSKLTKKKARTVSAKTSAAAGGGGGRKKRQRRDEPPPPPQLLS